MGPLGNPSTQELDADIAKRLKDDGWNITNGAGKPQEWIPGDGPGRTGGTAVDLKATRVVDGKTQFLRVQTVDTLPDEKTPTPREVAAAARIRAKFPDDVLVLVPKGADRSVWEYILGAVK